MALQLRDRGAHPANGSTPPDGGVLPAAPDFACETCGAAMQRGQDWCLECGTAAPGRLGQKPGWRAAFTVVGLSTLLLCAALIATYAALTTDAERTASAPPAGSAAPITAAPDTAAAPPAVVTPGATGPGVTAPPAPVSPLVPPPNPPQGATNTPVTPPAAPPPAAQPPAAPPPAAAGTGSTGTGTDANGGNGSTGATAATTDAVTIEFKKDAAQTYDPIKRAGAEFGPPEDAIDDKPDTVWDVTVPADGQPIDAGIVVDLGKPYALRSLRIETPTDGFTVEVYGAKSAKQLPEDVIDKRWIHLTDKKFVLDNEPILLKGKGGGAKVQLVLLHIKQAADPDDPHVAIGNIKLRGTP